MRAATGLTSAQELALVALISQRGVGVAATVVTLQIQATVVGRPVLRAEVVLERRTGRVRQWSLW